MTRGETILDIRNLTVRAIRGGRDVVENVSFTVAAGETVCVVGESGSGKSVTAMSVMGLLAPGSLKVTGGSVVLDGETVTTLSAKRLQALRATHMGMVFQEPMTALNPVQTVGRQVDEVLRLHRRMDRAARRAAVLEMFASVQLPDPQRLYNAFPHQLSGGQRQRVVIAMALILKPRLLIADEPTTALDVTTQRQVLDLIRELQDKHGTAVLFITHDFGVVADIADRIVVMNHGKLVETGARDQMLTAPVEDYTRRLISAVPSLKAPGRAIVDGPIVLDARDVGRRYTDRKPRWLGGGRDIVAAEHIDIDLKRGEIVGVVGESGSGKSTLARCLVRLITPTSGSIVLGGTDIAQLSPAAMRPHRKRVQIVFQDPYRSLNPRRRIGESLIEGLRNQGVDRATAMRQAGDMLAEVGLDRDALDRYPHQFSGGQRQRICLARALVLEPDVLIADEAVSALDVSIQAQVLTLIDTIRARTGIGIVFITHDLRVAAQLCDRLLVMKTGRVVEHGATAQVLEAPAHEYTRSLIAAAPGQHWDFQHFRPIAGMSPATAPSTPR